jgi:hypothetical protein
MAFRTIASSVPNRPNVRKIGVDSAGLQYDNVSGTKMLSLVRWFHPTGTTREDGTPGFERVFPGFTCPASRSLGTRVREQTGPAIAYVRGADNWRRLGDSPPCGLPEWQSVAGQPIRPICRDTPACNRCSRWPSAPRQARSRRPRPRPTPGSRSLPVPGEPA